MSGERKAPGVVRPVPRPIAAAPRAAVRPQPAVPRLEPERVATPARPPRAPSGITLTEADVRACYRLLLGREPESEAVVATHLARSDSAATLLRRFTNSDEYAARRQRDASQRHAFALPALPIELAASDEALGAMLDRTARAWDEAGRQAPHWSVLNQARFRPEEIGATVDAFYATGAEDARLVEGLLLRHGVAPGSLRHVLEFGCGVGRATLALARIFPWMTGCDISAPHLALAAAEARARVVDNLGWHQAGVTAPMPGGGWDGWISRGVLQHNPPPVMAYLLRWGFAGLQPGGIAIFQVPTHQDGYGFAVGPYLASGPAKATEMHVLPQPTIFALAREAGLEVLEVREDTQLLGLDRQRWVSNLFVCRRPA